MATVRSHRDLVTCWASSEILQTSCKKVFRKALLLLYSWKSNLYDLITIMVIYALGKASVPLVSIEVL